MSVSVEVQGMIALQKNLIKLAKATPESVVKHAALMVQRSAMQHATGRPGPHVITGRLHASINIEIENLTSARVGTNTVYACVVGAKQKVYEPVNKTAHEIGSYPSEIVLSKDGVPHRIEARHKFSREPIEAVSILTRQGRNPLVVTADHLILAWRNGNVIWESAQKLKDTDMVFGKRSHNAVTDNSNKESFLCFCGTIFWVEKNKCGERKYCSRACRHKYGPHDQNKGMHWTLTEEQRAARVEGNLGENNPNWRGGAYQQPYHFNFNGKLKAQVKERDGYQCQTCLTPFDLVVHHIDWDKMNSSIDNLITLCRSCHGKLASQDCELPEVNLDVFIPKPILRIESLTIKRKSRERVPRLYDFTVNQENSFMVSGLLVHNSFVEFGHRQEVGRFVPMFSAGQKNVRGAFKGTYNGEGLGLRLVNPTAPAYPFMTPAANDLRGQFPELSFQVKNDIENTSWQK